MPHAWKAGEQTLLLRKQLEAMDDGGLVVISAPANPFRCPPGPYERASLIAHYLKTKKPRSKLLILDAKDTFSKQRLFQNAWKELYPGMIEWVSLSQGGKVNAVDAATNTLITDFGNHTAQVANVIPPQRAGRIAAIAGAADHTGWCPIDPVTFESKLGAEHPRHRRRRIAGAMPKSAFSANSQAKACASAVATLLAGRSAGRAEADQYLLQPGGARLRHLGRRRLRAEERRARRRRRRRRRQPGGCASRFPHARGRLCAKPGSRRSRRKSLARRRHRMSGPILAGALLALPGFAAAQELRSYAVTGDAIPASLTGAPGDPARGRALVLNRSSTCLLCHSGPFPEERFQGDLAPSLAGAGSRWSEGQLRLRLVDAASLNPATIMPSYYRIDGLTRVGAAWRGKPILIGRADRGRGGVSRDVARIGSELNEATNPHDVSFWASPAARLWLARCRS